MPAKPKSFDGSWRIIQMDEWNEEFPDIVETTRITIDKRGQGDFIFGVVKGLQIHGAGYPSSNFPGMG